MIVSASTAQSLAAALADRLDESLAPVAYERFPDGEFCASVPEATDIDGERAIVVGATTTPEAHLELLQLQDALREAGASQVVTVISYLGYARQDEAFAPGHPVSARAMARAISSGTDRVLVVSPHEERIADFFEVPCTIVDAATCLAEPLPALDRPVFFAPDEGALDLARAVRDADDARTDGEAGIVEYFEKTRRSGTEIEIEAHDVAVADRDVVVVDDIVATGNTMAEAIGVLRDREAARVFVACVHPVFAGAARTKLARAGVESVFGTDTIEGVETATSVAPVVIDALDP